jgi:MFS family permease
MASIAGMAFAGVWVDRINLYRVALVTMLTLAFGSLIIGFSNSLEIFVAGRILQGFALGIDLVTMYVIVGRAYPETVRPKALGMLAGAWVIPGLVGPALAGAMVHMWSWRSIFLVIPLVLLLPLTLLLPRLHSLPPATSNESPQGHVKTLAVILLIGGLTMLQFMSGRAGHETWQVVAAGIAFALSVIAVSTRWLMPRGFLVAKRGLPAVIALRGLVAASYFSTEVFIPLALQNRGVSVTMSGLILGSACVMWFAGSSFQGSASMGWSRSRFLLFGFTTLVMATLILPFAVLVPSSDRTAALATAAVWSFAAFGVGVIYPTLGVLLLEDSTSYAADSASLQMSDSLGVIVGTAIAGAFLTAASVQGSPNSNVFSIIWLLTAAIGGVALLLAPRVQTTITKGNVKVANVSGD